MNHSRLRRAVTKDFSWKLLFTIILFLFIVFFTIFSSRISYIRESINLTEKYLSIDIYQLYLERYPQFFNIQVEDNINDSEADVNQYWQEHFSENGRLGSIINYTAVKDDIPYEVKIILGKASYMSNFEPVMNSQILISQNFNEEDLRYFQQKYTEVESVAMVPDDFFLNDTYTTYTSESMNTIYYFTNNYMALRQNPHFQIYSDMIMDRLISVGMDEELADYLQNYAWEVYGGHFIIESYVENYESAGKQEYDFYQQILIFFSLCLVAVFVLCVSNIVRLTKIQINDYIVYRQFGSTRKESLIYIFNYTLSTLLPAIIISYFITSNLVAGQQVFAAKIMIVVLIIIAIILAAILAKVLENKTDKAFSSQSEEKNYNYSRD